MGRGLAGGQRAGPGSRVFIVAHRCLTLAARDSGYTDPQSPWASPSADTTMGSLSAGRLFANRFEIIQLAASGGMGSIYRARDRYSGDVVALKLLHPDGGSLQESERFVREAQLLAELHDPG